MEREFPLPDKAYKKKKVVVILCALLLILLCMSLAIGRLGDFIGAGTPSPTAVAVASTLPPTTTVSPTVTPTETALPTVTPPAPTNTPSPPTITPHPSTPTLPPSPTPTTPSPSTPTPSPSPTPATPSPPTPTPSPSPTVPPTSTPTARPTSPRPPVIQKPVDGSELPSEGLRVEGTAEPGTRVEVYTGDISLGEAAVDKDGNWSLIPIEGLSAGDHTIVAIDTATNLTSAPVTFTLVGAWLPVTGGK